MVAETEAEVIEVDQLGGGGGVQTGLRHADGSPSVGRVAPGYFTPLAPCFQDPCHVRAN